MRQQRSFFERRRSRRQEGGHLSLLPGSAWLRDRPAKARHRAFAVLTLAGILASATLTMGWFKHRNNTPPTAQPAEACPWTADMSTSTPTGEVSALLGGTLDELDGKNCLELQPGGPCHYTVFTALDEGYQERVADRLRRSMAEGGVVAALDPATGRILALASFNKDPDHPEAFASKAYPSASLFKIVTASAALDLGLLTPASVLSYNGRAHTLYRSNLSQKKYRWSNEVTLTQAFARSVNPVFGKIGIYSLGQRHLRDYGNAFFFDQILPSDVPFETGRLRVPEDRIGIAEIASGFNKKTLIAPLQAAWIAGVIAAGGACPAPWLVQAVIKDDTEAVYYARPEAPIRVLSNAVARDMQGLMAATIRYGTCRKSFRKRTRYRCLRPLEFGGKTGNVNNRSDTRKYDWFLGYARERNGGKALALAVLMIHGEYLGHRANVMAFDLMKAYFCRN